MSLATLASRTEAELKKILTKLTIEAEGGIEELVGIIEGAHAENPTQVEQAIADVDAEAAKSTEADTKPADSQSAVSEDSAETIVSEQDDSNGAVIVPQGSQMNVASTVIPKEGIPATSSMLQKLEHWWHNLFVKKSDGTVVSVEQHVADTQAATDSK